MSISCQFWDCKALLVLSLNNVNKCPTFTFTYLLTYLLTTILCCMSRVLRPVFCPKWSDNVSELPTYCIVLYWIVFIYTYLLRYYVACPGCGGQYSFRSGVIMSQNYPHMYPRRTDCIWRITVEPLHRVILNFSDFDLENSTNCRFDYVIVSSS